MVRVLLQFSLAVTVAMITLSVLYGVVDALVVFVRGSISGVLERKLRLWFTVVLGFLLALLLISVILTFVIWMLEIVLIRVA